MRSLECGTVLELLREDPDLHILHLTRRNPLATLRSLTQAEQTNRWVAQHPSALADMPTVRLTPERCRSIFEHAERFAARVRQTFADHHVLELTYEEFCAEHEVAISARQRTRGRSANG
jgi:LPS sulfotransferase NodH